MKEITMRGIKDKFHFSLFIAVLGILFLISCEPENNRLGVDIFPPSDTIMIYPDTIANIEASMVKSRHWITSVESETAAATRTFFLGNKRDTITGHSNAEIVTEFSILTAGNFGEEPTIDSLYLNLYCASVIGDTTQEMHILVYEFLDSLDTDSTYYNDYDITGRFNPEPLVDEIIIFKPQTVYEFKIENLEYLNRIIDATNPPDSVFYYNSKVQRKFPGLYIKTETVESGGALAKFQLANSLSGLTFKYQHDSITESQADTIPFSTYTMGFNYLLAQKINLFKHDYSGTAVETLLDNPDADPAIGYVQGMAGISVKVTLPNLDSYLDFTEEDKIAITAAKLLFYVVPDSISGIEEGDYPENLMMDTQLSDGSYQDLYDYVIGTSETFYGKLTQSNEQSAFLDPIYYYSFNIGRHLQSVLYGEIENSDLIIHMDEPAFNSKIIKFWCNYPEQKGGLRLELVYTKF